MRNKLLSVAAMAAVTLGGCNSQSATTPAPAHDAAAAPAKDAEAPATKDGVAAPKDSAPGADTAQDAGNNYTAFGADWRAVVTGGNMVALEGTSLTEEKIAVEKSAFAKGVDFTGPGGMALTIKSAPCKDANGSYDMEAKLSFKGKNYTGCATLGATEHADT